MTMTAHPRKGVPIRQPHHANTSRPMRLIVDISISDKTDVTRLGRDVTRWLERIPGVTVHKVAKAVDGGV